MRIFWRIHVLLHAPFDEELVLLPLLRRQAGSSCRGPSHAQVESLRFHLELQSRSWQTNSSAWLLTICREAKSSSGCRVRTPTIRSLVSPLTSQHLEGYRIFFLLQAGPAAVALQYRQRSATEEEDHLQGQRLSRSSLTSITLVAMLLSLLSLVRSLWPADPSRVCHMCTRKWGFRSTLCDMSAALPSTATLQFGDALWFWRESTRTSSCLRIWPGRRV